MEDKISFVNHEYDFRKEEENFIKLICKMVK